jgi:hypothetical protein
MKRGGRPRVAPDDQSVSVTVRFPARVFDAMCRRALRESVSVPELIRRELRSKEFLTRRLT